MNKINSSGADIDLFNVYNFFCRQFKYMLAIFIVVLVFGLVYAFTRPTLFLSSSNITIGKSVSLDSNSKSLLDSPQAIAYRYSGDVNVTPVKDTDIVKISSLARSNIQSEKNVRVVIDEIMHNQGEIYKEQEKKLIKYIEIFRIDNSINEKFSNLLHVASTSSSARATDIVANVLPYSGKIRVNIAIAILLGFFLALLAGFVRDCKRIKKEQVLIKN